jgi:hypothetical protein
LKEKSDNQWLGIVDQLHGLHTVESTVARFNTTGLVFVRTYQTNVYKTTVENVDDLKFRIMEGIRTIIQETVHDAFLKSKQG